MDQIQHSFVPVRGIKLHVAEIGSGDKVVLFLHGFPEIWYTWRHQMIAVANAGYRALAIDFRGYGLSEQPPEPEKVTFNDMVADLFELLEALNIPKVCERLVGKGRLAFLTMDKQVFTIGKDWGAIPAYHLAVLHPERVVGVVTLGVPFILPGPSSFQDQPKGFYMLKWKEPGRAEADFGRFDVRTVIKRMYILLCGSELQIANDDQEVLDLADPSTPLPPWFTEDDLTTYATLYEKSGFRTALQVPYRTLQIDCGVSDPKVEAPALLIMGEKDYVYKLAGMKEYIASEKLKELVPNLEITFMPEGNHFVQEQLPEQVNQLIISFLNKQST